MFMPICSGEHLQLGYYWPNCKWFLDCIFSYLQLGYSPSCMVTSLLILPTNM
jgi:hypothetical protein